MLLEATHRTTARQQVPTDDGDVFVSPLIESLVCDTHTAGLLTAAVASIVNRIQDTNIARSESDLMPNLPKDPTSMIAFRRWTSDAEITSDTLAAVISFFAELESARRMIGQYFADVRLIGADRAAVLHQFTLAKVWRAACHSGRSAIVALNYEFEDSLPGLYTLNVGILTRLLDAAAQGEAPLLSENGQVYFPELPQRRRSARRILNQAAMLQHRGTTSRAFVRDVSEGGLGLDQAGKLETGHIAVVELSSGRRLTGSIVWCKRGRAGLKFARLLSPNDPLLRG